MQAGGLPVRYTAQKVDDIEGLMRRYPSELSNKYYHHSTNLYGRQPFDDREGEKMRLHITGRLRNGVVDALVVDNPNSSNKIPHITLATAEGVKPVASNTELAAHMEDVEPLDDYVDTTFTNFPERRRDESAERLRRIISEAVSSVLSEKIGGHNYAGRGDEFYTRYSDIDRELSNYDFNGKVVYCNCDDPEFSNFYRYFHDNFGSLGLRGLYATWYSDNPQVVYFDGKRETRKPLRSGRFQDNGAIMSRCDVVVTNPPFSDSMPQQLVNMARKMGKHMIMIGPLNMARRNDMLDMVKKGELNYGYTPINRYSREGGKKDTAPTAWWTTMPVSRGEFRSGRKYDPSVYRKMDDSDVVNCDRYEDIPDDYEGEIAVPWRFLGKLNPKQYSVVGKKRGSVNGRNLDTRLLVRRNSGGFAESVCRRVLGMLREHNSRMTR